MRRLSEIAAAYVRAIYVPGSAWPTAALVFLAIALVSALQMPASLLIGAGFISAGVVINEIVVMAGVPLAIIRLAGFERRRMLPLKIPSAATAASVVILTLGAVVLIDFATAASEYFVPLPLDVQAQYDLLMKADAPLRMAWKFVILCLLPGICEEVFFRGFCQGSLARRWGNAAAIFVTALVFAILHGNPWYIHLYVLLGILFGWVFAVTGSLWASILCHLLNNSWTFFSHALGLKLPGEGWPILLNAAIFSGGAVLFLIAVKILRRQMQQRH